MKSVYFVSCAEDGGIYHYKMDGGGTLFLVEKTHCPFPMYAIKHGQKLYVLLRYPFIENEDSGILSYELDEDGRLFNPSAIISTQGSCGCHLCCFHNRIYAANYFGGTIACSDGRIRRLEEQNKYTDIRTPSHPHFVGATPDNRYLLAVDLGLDSIFMYDTKLQLRQQLLMETGSGPRHLVFVDEHLGFVVNELSCSLTQIRYENEILKRGKTISVLTEKYPEVSGSAAIRYLNGYIYVSTRGVDCISQIKVDENDMELVKTVFCGGKSPRDFAIVDDILLCANQESSTISILKESANFEKTGEVKIPQVLCVCT